MALRSLWRVAFAATTVAGGARGAAIASSDDPATAFKLCTAVPVRLFHVSVTAASIAFEGSTERSRVKHDDVHIRGARRLEELCFKNGGIYIKLGQHLGQLMYASQYFPQITELLRRLPPVILLMLKTNDCS